MNLIQSLIGTILYHFASGEFGATLIGGDLFEPAQVARRKAEVKALVLRGLAPSPEGS